MKYLTIALAKGRLAKKSLALFEQIGISMDEMKDPDTRKLIFVNEDLKIKMFLAKASDVPTYVEYGAADIGVVGKDTLLEEGRRLYEVLDLGFGKCRMWSEVSGRVSSASGADPCGIQVSRYCEGLLLQQEASDRRDHQTSWFCGTGTDCWAV